ncbi:MAG: type II secretion system F family protein [Patescibacteria group bacterium]|mgnify:CR=1 FL=1
MKYKYKARTREGKIETGVIEAYSSDAAAALLQKYNLFAVSLQEESVARDFFKISIFGGKVSRKDLAIFFRQLAVMLESRVPVVQSLNSLASQTKKGNFKTIIAEISRLVEEGVPLSEAFASYPKIFSNFYINLVKSGEASGNIASSLNYISEHVEREHDIIAQVRQALIYPIFVVAVLFVVIGIIIIQVMPRIADLIREASVKPPLFTVMMIKFYEFVESYWWAMLITMISIIFSLFIYSRTKKGRENFHILSLKIPFLSGFLKKIFLTRFCGNISTLVIAGISINKALEITGDTINNTVYKKMVRDIEKEVSEGEKISASMAKYLEYFPPFVVQMIRVGEETGKLDKTLLEVVNFYQKEIKRAIELFSTLLEPIMIIFLGVIVAMLAISVLAPLYGALGSI